MSNDNDWPVRAAGGCGPAPLPLGTPPHVVQTTLYLVIQEGGSSDEHYPTLYNQLPEAQKGARGHRKASYRATDPIAVPAELRDGVAYVAEDDLIELITEARRAEYL